MPFYERAVLDALRESEREIRSYTKDNTEIVDQYRTALTDALAEYDNHTLREELGVDRYPGGLPTSKWDAQDTPTVTFDNDSGWDSHEAVNEYAKSVLEGVTTIAADGSELGPTDEFTVPLGLVQVAWIANHHRQDGNYEEGIETELLGLTAVTVGPDDGEGVRYPDELAPKHERYRLEGRVVVDCIERCADLDPPPVVIYDGPLAPTFANTYANEDRDYYYRETMSKVLAASEHHEVPVVGYSAGGNRTNITKMLRRTYRSRLEDLPYIPDDEVLSAFTSGWGDRSLLFANRQDGTLDALQTSYRGADYAFGTDLLFGYLDTGDDNAMDYLELPGWILEQDLVDHVFDVVRAEVGIGRGYPEIIQVADANAVLDVDARRQFLSLVQEFAEEEDIPLEWSSKRLSKERRRR